jgi:hypothetical protein
MEPSPALAVPLEASLPRTVQLHVRCAQWEPSRQVKEKRNAMIAKQDKSAPLLASLVAIHANKELFQTPHKLLLAHNASPERRARAMALRLAIHVTLDGTLEPMVNVRVHHAQSDSLRHLRVPQFAIHARLEALLPQLVLLAVTHAYLENIPYKARLNVWIALQDSSRTILRHPSVILATWALNNLHLAKPFAIRALQDSFQAHRINLNALPVELVDSVTRVLRYSATIVRLEPSKM